MVVRGGRLALHRAFPERSRFGIEGRQTGATSARLEPQWLRVVLWSAPFSSLASAPASRRSNSLPSCAKNWSMLPFGALGAFLPPQRLGGPGSRLGARPEERRLAATPPSPGHLALGSRNRAQCPPVTRSDWVGRPREEQARLRPSLSRSGPAWGRDGYPRRSGLGGGPGCRASQGLFPPGRGRTLGAARRPESRCAQVRPRAGPQCLVHIHAGRGPAPALPGAEDWPESGRRPPPEGALAALPPRQLRALEGRG